MPVGYWSVFPVPIRQLWQVAFADLVSQAKQIVAVKRHLEQTKPASSLCVIGMCNRTCQHKVDRRGSLLPTPERNKDCGTSGTAVMEGAEGGGVGAPPPASSRVNQKKHKVGVSSMSLTRRRCSPTPKYQILRCTPCQQAIQATCSTGCLRVWTLGQQTTSAPMTSSHRELFLQPCMSA